MKYLKKHYSNDLIRYIPLDGSTFEFEPAGNLRFKLSIISNGQTFCISEGRHFYDSADSIIKNIMNVRDGEIVSLSDIW